MATVDLSEVYTKLNTAINAIDEKLDSQEDSATSGVRAFRAGLVAEYGEKFEPSGAKLADSISNLSVEELVAVLAIINKALAPFEEKAKTFVAENAPKKEASTEAKMAEDELNALFDTRAEIVKQIKQVISMAKIIDEEAAETMVEPKRRNKVLGKRGPQVLSTYSFQVFDADGNEVELDEDDGINDIAKANGYDNGRALRAAIKTNGTSFNSEGEEAVGIDVSNPPATFKLLMGSGNELVATRPAAEVA